MAGKSAELGSGQADSIGRRWNINRWTTSPSSRVSVWLCRKLEPKKPRPRCIICTFSTCCPSQRSIYRVCVWMNIGWRASFSLGFPGSVGTSLACFAICRKCYAKPGRRSSVVAHPKQTFHSRKDHIFYLRRTLTREEAFGNSTRSLGSFVIPVSIMVHATGQPECFTNTLWWFSENFWANRELKWTR